MRETAAPDQRDLVGAWQDEQGNTLPDGRNGIMVIASSAGSSTCVTGENVTVTVELAWPPGRRLDWSQGYEADDTYRYLRDTTGSSLQTDGTSDLNTSLPAAARSTGIGREGNLVFAVVGRPEAIWVRRPDGHVERWAALDQETGCA